MSCYFLFENYLIKKLLFFYAFSISVTGLFIKKINPKILAISGSFLIGLAWILASFAKSIEFIIITYGTLGEIGVGIIYGISIAVVTEWFPDCCRINTFRIWTFTISNSTFIK